MHTKQNMPMTRMTLNRLRLSDVEKKMNITYEQYNDNSI